MLEGQFPPAAIETTPTVDAIVVLGGGVSGPAPLRLTVELSDAADRVLYAARLYRDGKAPIVMVSGGAIPWLGSVASETEAMQSLLEERGVPAASIIFETKSRNTRENAVFTEQLLAEHGLQGCC